MLKEVRKRNGKIENFQFDKIVTVIEKAGKATNEFGIDIAKSLGNVVLCFLNNKNYVRVGVEDLQDIIEKTLMSLYPKTAKAFILYRDQHRINRQAQNILNSDLMENYLSKSDWEVKENANMCFSLQGLNNYLSSALSKNYWLNSVYPGEIREAHNSGDLHIHDLGNFSVYCMGWDLSDLLRVGFKGVSGKIESSPPKHFRTALGQIVNFVFTTQGETSGAIALSNFDTLLAPFIFYDHLSRDQVKQALQEFLFNMNVPTRTGFQSPFSNITLDLQIPGIYEDQGVVIGGEIKKETYGEFQDVVDLFNDVLFEVFLEGDSKGRVFTFPIPTINIIENFNYDNPAYEKLWKMTGKYGIPYFANFVNSDMSPDDVRSMCCRLKISNDLLKRGGGLFGANPLTGSIGVVTVNMPRIGYLSDTEDEFFNRLTDVMYKSYESLEIKRKILERYTEKDLYPYTKFYLRDIKKRYGVYWKNHFSTIGLVGMNEACLNFLGVSIVNSEGQKFSKKVLKFMRERLTEYQNKSGNLYNLEATPAEGTSYRLALLDQKKYKNMVFANTDNPNNPFYTNSSQLPVNYTEDLFQVLDLQDGLQTLYTGGTVVHLFLGEMLDDCSGIKELIKKVSENYQLPYFSITPTFSVCPNCGYLKGEIFNCKKCGSETEVYTRIVGYLRPVKQWNAGKTEEYKMRKVFKIDK